MREAWLSGVGDDCGPLERLHASLLEGRVTHELHLHRSSSEQLKVYEALSGGLVAGNVITVGEALRRADASITPAGQISLTTYPDFIRSFLDPVFVVW
jgi:hypothetical protein